MFVMGLYVGEMGWILVAGLDGEEWHLVLGSVAFDGSSRLPETD